MVVLRPEPLSIEHERSKALLFKLITNTPSGGFDFVEMLGLWFNADRRDLAAFLDWLDARGLEIKNKQQ